VVAADFMAAVAADFVGEAVDSAAEADFAAVVVFAADTAGADAVITAVAVGAMADGVAGAGLIGAPAGVTHHTMGATTGVIPTIRIIRVINAA
jgi:hypothetical protein